MKAIILAGGFGTRLKQVVADVPKPMAPINGVPFLEVLIQYLEGQGFTEFVLSVHHMRGTIIEHFSDKENVSYAIEEEPLGTGGAIVNSIKQCAIEGNVAVLNGDSFLKLDYAEFYRRHGSKNFSMALMEVPDTARYGRVEVDAEKVTAFKEKGESGKGLINAGSYIVNADWFVQQSLPESFSLETDFLLPNITALELGYYITGNYFIDIGIPEDYERAQHELSAQ